MWSCAQANPRLLSPSSSPKACCSAACSSSDSSRDDGCSQESCYADGQAGSNANRGVQPSLPELGTAGRSCPEPILHGIEAMQLTAHRGAPQGLNASMRCPVLQQATLPGQEYAPPVQAVQRGPLPRDPVPYSSALLQSLLGRQDATAGASAASQVAPIGPQDSPAAWSQGLSAEMAWAAPAILLAAQAQESERLVRAARQPPAAAGAAARSRHIERVPAASQHAPAQRQGQCVQAIAVTAVPQRAHGSVAAKLQAAQAAVSAKQTWSKPRAAQAQRNSAPKVHQQRFTSQPASAAGSLAVPQQRSAGQQASPAGIPAMPAHRLATNPEASTGGPAMALQRSSSAATPAASKPGASGLDLLAQARQHQSAFRAVAPSLEATVPIRPIASRPPPAVSPFAVRSMPMSHSSMAGCSHPNSAARAQPGAPVQPRTTIGCVSIGPDSNAGQASMAELGAQLAGSHSRLQQDADGQQALRQGTLRQASRPRLPAMQSAPLAARPRKDICPATARIGSGSLLDLLPGLLSGGMCHLSLRRASCP